MYWSIAILIILKDTHRISLFYFLTYLINMKLKETYTSIKIKWIVIVMRDSFVCV